ncbi:MAG: hypothetical protein RIQ79_1755 [Verrucomicrobiota bacterium]|jgi:hypothetical protein
MTLFLATLLVGLVLLAFGGALASDTSVVRSALRAFPRSTGAAYVLFGTAAAWFLYRVAYLSEADFGQFRTALFIGFAAVAVLSFFYVSEFLAVRGLAALVLLSASPLLATAFTHYEIPQRLFMVGFVYAALTLALYLGAAPYRLRDIIEWLQRVPGRARWVGALFAAYGLLLAGVSLTY